MAFTVEIDGLEPQGTGTVRVYGTAVNTAADTGGIIELSDYITKMYRWGFVCSTAEEAAQVVKTYDHVTYDADILTITNQALSSYNFWIEGKGT